MMSESRKSRSVEIDRERLIGNTECIDAHIEFLATNQQWIADVFLNYIWVCLNPSSFNKQKVKDEEKYVFCLPGDYQDHSGMCFSMIRFP